METGCVLFTPTSAESPQATNKHEYEQQNTAFYKMYVHVENIVLFHFVSCLTRDDSFRSEMKAMGSGGRGLGGGVEHCSDQTQ